METIKRGSRVSAVRILQMALGVPPDGIFGAATEKAVIAYQKANGLTPDGIVGPKTWSKLGYQTSETPNPRNITELIVHCAATPEGRAVTSATIDAGHKARKFSSYTDPKTGKLHYIGYHYIVHLDGAVEACRPENVRGCHCTNHNAVSIGVCYIGGVATDGKTPKDTRTAAQKAALVKLLRELKAKYPKASIHGHREFAAKACPSFDAKTEYANL